MKYLDSVALARLRSFPFELRRVATESGAVGRHRSAWRAPSHEFAQHRPYVPGDELKLLDWKVFGRQDRYFVREYQAESLLSTSILVDRSGSMGYSGGGRPPKWDYACRLAMSMAYLILARGDAAGLATFDTVARGQLPPRAALSHLELMDAALAERPPEGETDLAQVLERAAARVRRRSLIVLVSDLLGEPERVLQVARAVKARKHELIVMQVLDPDERDFPFDGPAVFESLEPQPALFCDATALAAAYRAEMDRTLRLYQAGLAAASIGYGAFYTDRPWDAALARFLAPWR